MIHNANHIRPGDEVKVGGHQASCASMVSIMTALYFATLKPQDRVAVKPHASPVFHAMQYLMGNQSLENIRNFRGSAVRIPIPAAPRTPTTSTSRPARSGSASPSRPSLRWCRTTSGPTACRDEPGRMIALVGDAELDEGNIYEALQEGWKHDLRNVWWIIDYNRQSLDGVVHEGLWPAHRGDLRGVRLGSRHRQARRHCSARRSRNRAATRSATGSTPAQPALLGAGLPGRGGVARASDGGDRRSGRGLRASRPPLGRRTGPS